VSNPTTGAKRVSYWSDKSGATTGWTAPAGESVRATTAGDGGGHVGTLLTDLPAALTAGSPASTGGLAATANASTNTATMWTVLLRPAAVTGPVNQPPTAAFDRTCTGRDCTFDSADSTDPDDGIDGWSWDFGDGHTSTDPVAEHVYEEDGTYTVTLEVTDDTGAKDQAQETFTLGTPPPPPPVAFVGQTSSNTNSTAFSVSVPAGVTAGNALLLFASQGSETVLTGPGAGWTQIGRVVDGGHATTVWRKVAVAADPGSTVQVRSGTTYTKVALTLAAYRGTDETNPVALVTGAPEPGSTAGHTTPSVSNGTAQALRVSYWSIKNSATTGGWTTAGGETTRASTIGTGGGRIGSLLTDPGTQQTAGSPATTGGLLASTNAAASSATMWTILLRPAG
jgi:PKD repeat protein